MSRLRKSLERDLEFWEEELKFTRDSIRRIEQVQGFQGSDKSRIEHPSYKHHKDRIYEIMDIIAKIEARLMPETSARASIPRGFSW